MVQERNSVDDECTFTNWFSQKNAVHGFVWVFGSMKKYLEVSLYRHSIGDHDFCCRSSNRLSKSSKSSHGQGILLGILRMRDHVHISAKNIRPC